MANFRFSPEKSKKNLLLFPFFLLIYSFCGNVSNDIYMPSMPLLADVFHTDNRMIQWSLSAWFLGDALPQLLLGPVADRFGRRPLLFIGGLVFLVATFICAVSTHIETLLLGRFFQGVGVCSMLIVSFAVIHELFEETQCIRWLSLISICNSIAPLAGPLIGGYIFLFLGWRANFYFVLVIALIGLIGLWFRMPESKTILDPNALQWENLLRNYAALLKKCHFTRPLLTYGLFFGGMIAYLAAAPFIIIQLLKVAPQHFGVTQLAIFGAFIVTSALLSKLVKHYDMDKIILFGSGLIVIASCVMVFNAYYFPLQLYFFLGSMMMYAAGFGLVASLLAKKTLAAGEAFGGLAAAILGFSMAGFSSVASVVVSLFYNGTILRVAFIILGITLLAMLIWCSGYQWKRE